MLWREAIYNESQLARRGSAIFTLAARGVVKLSL